MSKMPHKITFMGTEIVSKIKAIQSFIIMNTSNISKLVITPEDILIYIGVMSSLKN